ncbi:hypothetical protein H696_04386 [Fonticula alba]|uniref:3-beta hydroxysteroid dehydrogenase/isomerase domain-containing protein n=1 Tax=Fonticula alba TaxID=691883 RepID=A0A058Z4E1_FONAL|nr:hypothetical protein H696_04386 [Fonticula alba]KCV68966.1 hypothetical protein H696_04386 [Fonticula alba]|eukprot:XP_009496537.1 hypothetical protein H696_04386 [Fonticula alba]
MATFNHVYPNVTCLKDKKAVVIGGAGFLGGHMIEGLLAVGVSKVVVFDIVNISHPSDRVESVKGDLRNINVRPGEAPVVRGGSVAASLLRQPSP